MFRKNKIAQAVLAATACAGASQHALAQEGVIEEVIVKGIRGGLVRSMEIKRNAGGVVDSISAEDIGKFPDTNLAESLQRITGVSIDRSNGEGQSITVRGFGPSFNAVVVNGRRLASESETRGFSFDTISSNMVSGLDVFKSSLASLPSGGVGATVNIKTARPFDFDGYRFAARIAANYEDNSEETTPQASALLSGTFADDSFGVLLAFSHEERDTRIDQAQTDQWIENPTIPDGELLSGAPVRFAPQNFDQRVLFEERTRTNVNLVLQFAPSDTLTISGDVLFSDFDIESDATSIGHWFTPNNYENVTTDGNGTAISFDQPTGQATDFHAKTFDRLTDTTSFGLNFDWAASDNLSLSLDLWTSEANRDANNGNTNNMVLGYLRGASYEDTGDVLPTISGFQDAIADFPNTNGFVAADGSTTHDLGNFLDPSNPRAHVSIRGGQVGGAAIEDTVDEFKLSGVWDEGNDTGLVKAKFGAGISNEERIVDFFDNTTSGVHAILAGYLEQGAIANFNGQDIPTFDIPDSVFSVFDAGGDFLSDVSGGRSSTNQWLRVNSEVLFDIFETNTGIDHDAVRTGASFAIEEETTFAYLELDFAGQIADMAVSAVMGARYEVTDVKVDGTIVPLEALTIIDQTEFGRVFGPATPAQANTDYEVLLPNVSVKLDITDTLVGRFAASRTLTRPTLAAMAPVTNIVTTRPGGNLTARTGNSALLPFKSDNMDFSLEYYYKDASYVSLGYFLKNVENFIVAGASSTTFTDSSGNTIADPLTGEDAVFTVTSPTNSETAKLDGLEFAVQHSFDSGFGIIFNATFVDSDAELDVNNTAQTFALPGLSDSLNLVGFYERGPFQARLAFNQRDEFLQSLSQSAGAEEPVFVEEYEQWDFSGSFDINDQFTVFLDAINLTDEEVLKHGRFDNQFLSVDVSGRRVAFGVRGTF